MTTGKKKRRPSIKDLQKQASSTKITELTEEKHDQVISESQIKVTEKRKAEEKVIQQQKEIEALKLQQEEADQRKEQQKVRQKRTTRPKLTTIEDTEIPVEFFEEGETRTSILSSLLHHLSIYSRKKRSHTNAQLNLLIYNFLKEEGVL